MASASYILMFLVYGKELTEFKYVNNISGQSQRQSRLLNVNKELIFDIGLQEHIQDFGRGDQP